MPFFDLMKELALVAYYTSEIGGSQELQCVTMPVATTTPRWKTSTAPTRGAARPSSAVIGPLVRVGTMP